MRFPLSWWWLLLPTLTHASYANVTLRNKDWSVVVYLPPSLSQNNQRVFYDSSRFEHGSMIGSIQTKTKNDDGGGTHHTLYPDDVWRMPHNAYWPEAGVGLASEFGVGDDGALCVLRCGWYGVGGVSNGVLGYLEAKNGEPFLKIGVGMLVKGSCNTCDSSEDYKFNSPYQFAEVPVWNQEVLTNNRVELSHQAVLHAKKLYGYRLKKIVVLENNVLSVTSQLTNLGQEAFTTPWYSHHFFSCDGVDIGPGYSVQLDLKPPPAGPIYDEPSLWSWSTPLEDYAKVVNENGEAINVEFTKTVNDGARIKAEFLRDDGTDGSFTLRGCGTSIYEQIPEVLDSWNDDQLSMYAFNLYVERGTLSPEPQLLLHLEPGKTVTWTQRLEFHNIVVPQQQQPQQPSNNLAGSIVVDMETANSGGDTTTTSSKMMMLLFSSSSLMSTLITLFAGLLLVSATYRVVVVGRRCRRYDYYSNPAAAHDYPYTSIPDVVVPQQPEQEQG